MNACYLSSGKDKERDHKEQMKLLDIEKEKAKVESAVVQTENKVHLATRDLAIEKANLQYSTIRKWQARVARKSSKKSASNARLKNATNAFQSPVDSGERHVTIWAFAGFVYQ